MIIVLIIVFYWFLEFLIIMVVMKRIDRLVGKLIGLMYLVLEVNRVLVRLLMKVFDVKVSSLNLKVVIFMILVVFLFL